MIRDPYELSESLFLARKNILQYEIAGYFFRPGDIRNLSELFLLNGITAQQMGHEIARYRATGCMEAHPVVTTIVDHATRPGSNVVLLNINSDRLKP